MTQCSPDSALRFRKKPVVIEAVKALELIRAKTHGDFSNIPKWAIDANLEGILEIYAISVEVITLEGSMEGGIDDWIIRGVKGELYPCKPDIFAATYESASVIPDVAQAAQGQALVPIELVQRVWDNLYFDKDEVGTFQQTLNDVVDWLAALDAVPSTECGRTEPQGVIETEIERLRAVAWAAQGLLNADTYVSDIPRAQAVSNATVKLQQAIGVWQMHHTAQSSALTRPTQPSVEKTDGSQS